MDTESKSHSGKKDLRVKKTQKALFEVLFTMLGSRNFNEITVNDLCVQASVSRATFYTHFNDKYDLLKYFLSEIREDIVKDLSKYDELEREINGFIGQNKKVITNVFKNANDETLTHIRGFISDIVELLLKKEFNSDLSQHHIILFNFFIGGLLNQLAWMIENNFPPEISMMNMYLYKMLQSMAVWDAEQGEKILDA